MHVAGGLLTVTGGGSVVGEPAACAGMSLTQGCGQPCRGAGRPAGVACQKPCTHNGDIKMLAGSRAWARAHGDEGGGEDGGGLHNTKD